MLHVGLLPQGIQQENLRQLVKCSTGDLMECLTALQEQGRIIRYGAGVKGNPFLYKSVSTHITIEDESPAAVI